MASLKKYDLVGKEVGSVEIEDGLLKTSVNEQMVKDYLIAIRANARQWSASTKNRSEVVHTGKKPHPQKGTGKARQGCLAAPQYKGGGRVHAPRPKFDQHIRVNKKEKRAAVKYLLAEKIQEGRLHILRYEPLDVPKTKKLVEFLKTVNLQGRRVLFLAEDFIDLEKSGDSNFSSNRYKNLIRSIRNVPKVEFMLAPNISGYDVALSHDIIILEGALDELKILLSNGR